MSAVEKVLVVGAGSAGCVVAALLARSGVEVDVVEIHDDVTALGSGITVQGNALRVLREIGAWETAKLDGYAFNSTGIRLPDGTLVAELDDIKTGGPDLPATMGIERRKLAKVLVDTATGAGASLRLATTVSRFDDDGAGVNVTFSDGSAGRYDLVIGADGVRSTVRSMIGIDTEPEPTGMGIFRVFTGRPESITRTDLCFAGPCYIAGFCPTGEDSLYAYLVEPKQYRSDMLPEDRLAHVRKLAEAYHGPWDDIRELLTDPSTVHYTWFEKMLLERPWWRGRVALIGDAAHTCPPTVAQGAAQAMEDALVMAESLLAYDDLDTALDAFMDRRYQRAKSVVEASVQIGQWMIDNDPDADIPGLMMQTLGALCARLRDPTAPPTDNPHEDAMTERLITHLRHVDLAVPDYGTQRDFYLDLWGLTEVAKDGDLSYLAAEGSTEPFVVRLRQSDDKRIDLLAIGASDRASVDRLAAQLGAAGVQLISEPGALPTYGGGYGFRCFDGDGRTLEVSCDVEQRTARVIEPLESIPVSLSHVVINSPDPEGTVAWYMQHLGVAISDQLTMPGMGDLMWFLRCSPWHHTFAVVRGPHASLHHLSFEMRGIEENMYGTGRVMRAGIERIWGPGKHLAGSNMFNYFLDPSGNTMEYTTALEIVDEETWEPHKYSIAEPMVADQWGTANPMGPDVAQKSFNDPDSGLFVAPPV